MLILEKNMRGMSPPAEVSFFVKKHNLEGKEISELFEIEDLSFSIASWFIYTYGVTEVEKKLYNEYFKINNSENIYYSYDIEDSSFISSSNNIHNSKNVISCEEVNNSSDICNSVIVDNSSQIFLSRYIDTCEKVLRSKNCTNSKNVINSVYTINSEDIIDSMNVFNSRGIRDCNQIKYSYCCAESANLKYCLFCAGLKEKEYYIFNEPFEKDEYDFIVNQLNKLIKPFNCVDNWPEEIIADPVVKRSWDYRLYYNLQTARFWDWVKTLPNYNSDIIYKIAYTK